jgi:hypothetical protein
MSSEERDVQQTPTGHEIPVPSRKDVFADLAKVAKADPRSKDDESEDQEPSEPS